MPPRRWSRYAFSTMHSDEEGRSYLTNPVPFPYEKLDDNRTHTVRSGDTLDSIAAQYFAELSDPPHFSAAELWWVIGHFQPQPVHDATVKLEPGATLVVPSVETIRRRVFNVAVRRRRGLM